MPDATGRLQQDRAFLRVMIGVWVAVALLAVLLLAVSAHQGRLMDRVFGSVLSIALFSVVILACVFIWQRGRRRLVPLLGAVLSSSALVTILLTIWLNVNYPVSDMLARAAVVASAWGVLFPVLGFLGLARLRQSWVWTRRLAQLAACVFAIVITTIFVLKLFTTEAAQVLGVVAIVASCGALCVLALHWLGGIRTREDYVTTRGTFTLTCPRCETAQQVSVGRSKCGQCGLAFRIDIEEERCAKCGYVLYNLLADRCPECGTPMFAATVTTSAGRPAESPASDPPPAA
jgi:hypothetical protein